MIRKKGFLLLDTVIGLGLGCTILIISLIFFSGSYRVFMDFFSTSNEQREVILLDQTIRHDIKAGNEHFEAGDNYFVLGNAQYMFSNGKITRIVRTEQKSFEENEYSFRVYTLNGKRILEITETNAKNPENKITIMYNIDFVSVYRNKSESD